MSKKRGSMHDLFCQWICSNFMSIIKKSAHLTGDVWNLKTFFFEKILYCFRNQEIKIVFPMYTQDMKCQFTFIRRETTGITSLRHQISDNYNCYIFNFKLSYWLFFRLKKKERESKENSIFIPSWWILQCSCGLFVEDEHNATVAFAFY